MVRMTQRLGLALTVALVGAVAGLLPAGAALAQVPPDVEDQSQWLHNLWGTVTGPEYRWGQIITAGKTGTLDRVSLLLSHETVPAIGPIKISIQTVTPAGLPSGTQIGFGTIRLDDIPPVESLDWVDASIGGATVTAGTRYALLAATSGGTIR